MSEEVKCLRSDDKQIRAERDIVTVSPTSCLLVALIWFSKVKLVTELITRARKLNAKRIVLDSFQTMRRAHRIYRAVGFKDVAGPADFPEKHSY